MLFKPLRVRLRHHHNQQRPFNSLSRLAFMSSIAIVLFSLSWGCTTRTMSDRHPLLDYTAFGDSSPFFNVSYQLTGLSSRMTEEKTLHQLVHDVLDRYPNGFGPDLISGHRVERITVKRGNKTIILEVYSDEETKSRSTRQEEKEMFKKIRDEMLRVIIDETKSRSRSYQESK